MAPEEIAELLRKEFGDGVADSKFDTAHPRIGVKPEAWPKIARFLRDDARLGFNFLRCVTALDLLEDDQLSATFDLHAVRLPAKEGADCELVHGLCVEVRTPRNDPRIPSVADVWRAADWHEREAYDLMGILFENHPDSVIGPKGRHPRRILCPDDWAGHPLRKDYMFPMEYHGIPAVTE
ncbi:MAG TPA: NADH-quinone oxidoreductase subunit C, partial [Phycisphaerae bacterium]|nr:NADH-quinone oxidoreductase subunit C [Phycisphaerae bacterium]